jgi:hypothetical protein
MRGSAGERIGQCRGMQIRRPLAALLTALALASGGALTACTAASSGTTGTPADTAADTAGGNPGSVSQGNLPDTSDRVVTDNSGRAGGDQQGNP